MFCAMALAAAAVAGADATQDAVPAAAKEVPAAKPVAAVDRAVIISADGMRPDVLLRAHTPNIRGLMESGTFTMWARTVPQSITLPSHTSMLTGVTPERHRVLWNSDLPEPLYPKVPTIFEIAKGAGLTTAMVTGKSKFDSLSRPGSIDWEKVKTATDDEVGSRAAAVVREHKPHLLVVHFPGADSTGHGKGWGSPEQIAAIETIDRSVGLMLGALEETKLRDSTVIILSADHGGAGKSHGPNDPRSRHIPWIASGPGIRKGYDLTRDANLTVNTEDTFATACWFLGLRPPGKIDGKAIEQVLADRELLRDAK
jgi:predicted AlkP superfamily pyrophosphatase or phosphodiesterase